MNLQILDNQKYWHELNQPTSFPTACSNKRSKKPINSQNTVVWAFFLSKNSKWHNSGSTQDRDVMSESPIKSKNPLVWSSLKKPSFFFWMLCVCEKLLIWRWVLSCVLAGGTLVCCDSCPASFHADCVELPGPPEGTWYCNNCASGKRPHYGDIVWVKLGCYRSLFLCL